MAKNKEHTEDHGQHEHASMHVEPTHAAQQASVTVTIADTEVPLPIRFAQGHVLSDAEAKVIDAAYRRQFANNQNAAFKAWQAKAEDKRGDNPCTLDAMLTAYASYAPSVGNDGESALERARKEAGLRAVLEVFKEHNEAFKLHGVGPLGKGVINLPKGKGSAEAKDALVQKILASAKQTDRVQRHLDAVLAEKGKAKADDASNEPKVEVESVDF